MKALALFVSVMGFINCAQAGDQYTFHNLGFSSDGQYFAYGLSAMQDGSGFGVAEVKVEQVLNNGGGQGVSATRILEEGSGADALQAAMQAINFNSFNLTPKALQGVASSPQKANEAVLQFGGNKYQVKLSALAYPVPGRCFDNTDGKSRVQVEMIKTDSNGQAESSNIHFEYAPPRERTCARDYEIEQVIQFQNKAVLVISYLTTGFEGPNSEFMVVPVDLY